VLGFHPAHKGRILEKNKMSEEMNAKEAAMIAAKKLAQKAREDFIASLPVATDEELKAVIVAKRMETSLPKGYESTFKISKEQKTEEKVVTFTDEVSEEVVISLSIKSAKAARVKALKNESIRKGFETAVEDYDLVSVKVNENSKRISRTHKYVKEL